MGQTVGVVLPHPTDGDIVCCVCVCVIGCCFSFSTGCVSSVFLCIFTVLQIEMGGVWNDRNKQAVELAFVLKE